MSLESFTVVEDAVDGSSWGGELRRLNKELRMKLWIANPWRKAGKAAALPVAMKFAFSLVLVFAVALSVRATESVSSRPNIIFILCDDLGYGDVGVFYQNQRAAKSDRSLPFFSTPHIDSLAADGVQMMQHYCSAPVCAPSRASILTGLTQGHANVRDSQFDKALADTHTLGTVLQKAGYATAAFGKWGLQGGGEKREKSNAKGGKKKGKQAAAEVAEPAVDKAAQLAAWTAYPTKRGFDYYFGYVRHGDGHFHYPKEDGREVWQNDQEVSADLDKCYTTDLFTAQAKQWLTQQTKESPAKPFFVYLAFDTPHAKLQNPPCAYPVGGGLSGGVQWTGKPHAMLNTATGEVDGYMLPEYATATWDDDKNAATPEVPWPDVQRRYANDVRRIDFAVGDVLQLLKDLKIDDNTMVVFTSDNGPSKESYLPENYDPTFFRGYGPFDGIKRDTWEGGVREPTLARWPAGIPAGRRDEQPSGHWDWLSTFAEVAGVPVPAASDGVSLIPSLTWMVTHPPGTVYVEFNNNARTPSYADFSPVHRDRERKQMQVIFEQGYKGIRYDIQSAEDDFEIYDLTNDPQEISNLARKPEMAAVQVAMKAKVLRVRKADDSAPRPYDDALVPALATEPRGGAGLAWALFDGEWPWMPDFRTLAPKSHGEAKSVELSMAAGTDAFGVAFTAAFHVAEDGDYTFTLGSDGSTMLFVHDIRLIDEVMPSSSGTLHLRAGWHPVRLYYRHSGSTTPKLDVKCEHGGAVVDVEWRAL